MSLPPLDKTFAGSLRDLLVRMQLVERRLIKGSGEPGPPGPPGGLTAEEIRDIIGATLVAGANVTVTVDDAGDQITIAATGGGGGLDAEAVRDLIGATLVEGSNVDIAVDDAGNTITISATSGAALAPEVRSDTAGGYSYMGQAPNGTAEGSTGWSVTRLTLTASPLIIQDGTGSWTGRAAISYS